MKSRHFGISSVLVVMLALIGCNIGDIDGDLELPNHQGKVGLIVGSTTYTIRELLEELEDSSLTIVEDNSMLLKVIYTDSTGFDDIDEIIVVDDVTNGDVLSPGLDIPASPTNDPISFNQNLQFNYPIAEDEELDSISYTGGSISLSIQSTFNVNSDYSFTLDDIVDRNTGQPMVFSGNLAVGGNEIQVQDLLNHRTIAERVGDENIFTGTFVGTLYPEVGDQIQPAEALDYTIEITNVTFQTIYGYFGQKDFELQSQEIEIGFFEDIDVGGFTFKSPEITLTIDNAFGVPMGIDLSQITSSNGSGQSVDLTGSITESLQFVRAPSVNSVGNSLTSVISINSANSNLRDLMNISPNLITVAVSAQTNFNVDDPTENRNFVDQESVASILMEFELPLDVNLAGFSRNFDFDLDSLDLDDADTVNMRIKSLNLLPFTGLVDFQLINPGQADSILYEIADVLLIESPELPISGRAEEPEETVANITFFEESLDALKGATKINLIMNVNSFDSENGTFVKIYSDSNLELIVSLEASLNLEL